jgi:hypothetical protein
MTTTALRASRADTVRRRQLLEWVALHSFAVGVLQIFYSWMVVLEGSGDIG